MKIILPFPPSVNSMFGGGSNQKRFPSKKYKEWLLACPRLEPRGLSGVSLLYQYWFPDNRERDAENYIKATSDFLVKQGVLKNDSWKDIVSMLILPMGVDKVNPRVEIFINKGE